MGWGNRQLRTDFLGIAGTGNIYGRCSIHAVNVGRISQVLWGAVAVNAVEAKRYPVNGGRIS